MISLSYVTKNTSCFKKTNTSTLYKLNNDAYKVIDDSFFFYNEIMNHIVYNYQIHNLVSPNIILPNDLITNNLQIRGYKCRYIKGKTLEGLAKELDTEEKIALLNKLTNLLKEIHNYLVVGDINLENCMYDKNGNAYLIDFDLSTKLDERPSMMSLYNFTDDERKSIYSNLSTDKIKMGIVAASVLYDINFEDSLTSKKPYSNWNKFLQYTNNTLFKDYFKESLHSINKDENVFFYLDIPATSVFAKLIDEDKKLIRKMIK